MVNVEPMTAPLVTDKRLALCDLVCVMGERVVNSSAVNVKILTQVLHADAGAFDVPSGITHTPGAVPFELLIVEFRFGEPENKVCLVSLVWKF